MKNKNISIKKGLLLILLMVAVLFAQVNVFASENTEDPGAANSSQVVLPSAEETLEALIKSVGSTPEDLLESGLLVPGDSISDWIIYDYGLLGLDPDSEKWLEDTEAYVSEAYKTNGGLDRVMATQWQRTALAILAMGGDPTAFGTDKNGDGIDLIKDGTYGWTTTDDLGTQGLNAYIYALNVLDLGGYEIPEDALYTRDDIILAILNNQVDGAFGLEKGTPDVDITAMALQALARYKDSDKVYTLENGKTTTVRQSIDEALDWLGEQMSEDGYFDSYGDYSSESISQVLIALYSLGIDPEKDERFHTEEGSLLTAFASFLQKDGMFSHLTDEGSDIMATEQAIRALYAKELYENGSGGIFDSENLNISDKKTPDKADETTSGSGHSKGFLTALICMLAVFGIALAIIIRKGGKLNHV